MKKGQGTKTAVGNLAKKRVEGSEEHMRDGFLGLQLGFSFLGELAHRLVA